VESATEAAARRLVRYPRVPLAPNCHFLERAQV
jgi:hypothetical protein